MKICLRIFSIILLINNSFTEQRKQKQFSLFSVVQFPNDECTSSSSTTTLGTCLASSECANKGGAAAGSCAAGFGVCCVVSVSTCGDTVSTNITYIRNPGYPGTYTPTSSGSCSFTIYKASDDICQLRLDFQTMSGYTVSTAAASAGACTASFVATGQTGSNPPAICGTNTDYHMYVEFGADAADSITLKHTLDTAQKSWNILAKQIACTASWKAPTDCVQYFTGSSGTVKSYNFAGSQILQGMDYDNCIRQEQGYCRIQWQGVDSNFQLDTQAAPGGAATTGAAGGIIPPPATIACAISYVAIPDGSQDGITPLNSVFSSIPFQTEWCGQVLGYTGQTFATSIVSAKLPFILGYWTAAAAQAQGPLALGFSMDYVQLPC